MLIKYSKPCDDINIEATNFLKHDNALLNKQKIASAGIDNFPLRESCILCGTSLSDTEWFIHRNVKYLMCNLCNHVQTQNELPAGFPNHSAPQYTFDAVYPHLSFDAYLSRRNRVYLPKLEWVMDSMIQHGFSHKQLLEKNWLEIGSGAGYFLHALSEAGANNILGLEANEALVHLSNQYLQKPCVEKSNSDIADILNKIESNILVAFFVLEHLNQPQFFWEALRKQLKGHILIFAVPVFSFSTILDSAFNDHAARHLDNVLHTQLYTDSSIDYALKKSGYEIAATWYFGQDSDDLIRILKKRISFLYSEKLLNRMSEKFHKINDALQNIFDKQHFCDVRHIIAIKSDAKGESCG